MSITVSVTAFRPNVVTPPAISPAPAHPQGPVQANSTHASTTAPPTPTPAIPVPKCTELFSRHGPTTFWQSANVSIASTPAPATPNFLERSLRNAPPRLAMFILARLYAI